MTQRAAVMVCAALRARPRPELIRARPAQASGAIKRETMQSVVWRSVRGVFTFTSFAINAVPLRFGSDVGTHYKEQTERLDGQASENETSARCLLFEQHDG